MLDDIINAANIPIYLLAEGIFLFGTYRALEIGRVLVRGAYRNRALWTGGTMIALILFTIASSLPASNPLSGPAFALIELILIAFVDSSIKVAQETDFFHRSPLGWRLLRKPLYVILIGTSIFLAWTTNFEPQDSVLFGASIILWFGAAAVAISYSAAALFVGARKTPDRSMRRFVRMLGLTIICIVLFLTVWIPFSSFSVTVQDLGSLLSSLFIPAAAYFLYQAVMALSPVGRVEKVAPDLSQQSAASFPNQSSNLTTVNSSLSTNMAKHSKV